LVKDNINQLFGKLQNLIEKKEEMDEISVNLLKNEANLIINKLT
jgi:hypothetical protein